MLKKIYFATIQLFNKNEELKTYTVLTSGVNSVDAIKNLNLQNDPDGIHEVVTNLTDTGDTVEVNDDDYCVDVAELAEKITNMIQDVEKAFLAYCANENVKSILDFIAKAEEEKAQEEKAEKQIEDWLNDCKKQPPIYKLNGRKLQEIPLGAQMLYSTTVKNSSPEYSLTNYIFTLDGTVIVSAKQYYIDKNRKPLYLACMRDCSCTYYNCPAKDAEGCRLNSDNVGLKTAWFRDLGF